MRKKTFAVFTDFRRTAKVFPTNFISANIYSKCCFHAYQKQNHESFPYIMIKSNDDRETFLPRNFCSLRYVTKPTTINYVCKRKLHRVIVSLISSALISEDSPLNSAVVTAILFF